MAPRLKDRFSPSALAAIQARAVELRQKRWSNAKIGRELGIHEGTIRRWTKHIPISLRMNRPKDCNSTLPIVQFLHDFCLRNQISLPRLEKASGVSQEAIRNWFHNGRSPSLVLLSAVMQTLGYEITWTRTPNSPNRLNTLQRLRSSSRYRGANGRFSTPSAASSTSQRPSNESL